VLASFFLLAIWLDHSQPAHAVEETYALLLAYVAVSVAVVALTWKNWWLECRLAGPLHVVDILMFTALVFATDGYTSPFFTFFVFLILAATIRWGWRETTMTAAVVVLLYLAAGLTADSWGTADFDLRRFVIRSAYVLVLSMILIWFGMNQRALRNELLRSGELVHLDDNSEPPVREVVAYAAERFAAKRIVFAWWETEEPWTNVAVMQGGRIEEQRLAPGSYGELVHSELRDRPFVFNLRSGRVLLARDGRKRTLMALGQAIDPGFAERFELGEGLLIPVRDDKYAGELIVLDLPGLCSDDLKIARVVSAETSAAFQRVALFEMSEESASSHARLSIARDLHDSVMQFLAGMSFRLEGLRKSARAGGDVEEEIDSLQAQLSDEQRELRRVITQLRGGRAMGRLADLSESVRAICERASRQWEIACTFRSDPQSIETAARVQHDVGNLVREAVANAARHGKASEITISLRREAEEIELEVADNGTGFPGKAGFSDEAVSEQRTGPWSLSERVKNLDGTLMIVSGDRGSRVTIRLPMAQQS
jgi:signal transduction histidine kinase